jgi:mRNA interferase RelE/StbE
VDPVAYGKPLRHSLKGRWRLRVGDWRVVYLVDQKKRVVTITAIRHRKDVYEGR